MDIKGSFIALLFISLLYIGHATEDCSTNVCDLPEDDSKEEFCTDVRAFVACIRKKVVSNTKCSRLDRATSAALVIRLKLDHKECVFSDMEHNGVVSKNVADTASNFYRKSWEYSSNEPTIEESSYLEIQVCGFDDSDKTAHLEICESFHETLPENFFHSAAR